MKTIFLWLLTVLWVACKGGDAAPKVTQAKQSTHLDEAPHKALPTRVRLNDKVIADAHIITQKAVKELLSATLSLPGEVVADPDKSARVASPVAGRITQVRFKEGEVVKKGEVLATVRIPELGKVRSAHAATASKAQAAKANSERLRALLQKGLASKQEQLTAQAEASALDVEARAFAEQLKAMGTGEGGDSPELALRAPVSGVVLMRDAVVGQPITVDHVVASIADLDEVWFLARVFEKDLGHLKQGASAEVVLNAYPNERFTGVIEQLGLQIDPVARTVTARIRLTNRNGLLRIGLFGTARIAIDEASVKTPVLVLPVNALIEVGGKEVIFVKHPDGDFELHEVVQGASALGKVEILSGLREGEEVVIEGAYTLKSAVMRSVISEDE